MRAILTCFSALSRFCPSVALKRKRVSSHLDPNPSIHYMFLVPAAGIELAT